MQVILIERSNLNEEVEVAFQLFSSAEGSQ